MAAGRMVKSMAHHRFDTCQQGSDGNVASVIANRMLMNLPEHRQLCWAGADGGSNAGATLGIRFPKPLRVRGKGEMFFEKILAECRVFDGATMFIQGVQAMGVFRLNHDQVAAAEFLFLAVDGVQ